MTLTPGAQLTTLRSVPAITPTVVLWASTGYLDFVADCGADPTGSTDIAPAWDKAYALMSALAEASPGTKSATRLFIPPGLYVQNSAPVNTTWNFAGLTTTCELIGAGRDATILQLDGFDPPVMGNLQCVRLADFTVQGISAGNSCNYGFELAYIAQLAVIERVRIFNVQSQHSVLYCVYCTNVHVNDCATICCSSQTDSWAVVTIQGCLHVHYGSCVSYDVGFLNGVSSGVQYAGNSGWLKVVGDHLNGGDVMVTIVDSWFDEGAHVPVSVMGQEEYPLRSLVVRNVMCNAPVQPPQIAGMNLQYINSVNIESLSGGSANLGSSAAPTLLMSGIDFVHIRYLVLPPTPPARSNYISADSTVGRILIENSPTLLPANIFSKAGITELPGQVSAGSAASSGGLFVVTVPIPIDQAARLSAEVFLSQVSGAPHLETVGRLAARCVVENPEGEGAAFVPHINSVNPVNSDTEAFADGDPQVADTGFGAPTAVWTVSEDGALLTVTNPGAHTARVVAKLDVVLYGLGP